MAVQFVPETERGIETVAREPGVALIVPTYPNTTAHHDLIVASAAQHRSPAIYLHQFSAARGRQISFRAEPLISVETNRADSGSLREVIGARVRARKIRAPPLAWVQCTNSTKCARDGPGWNGSQKYCVSLATFPSLNSMMLTEYEGEPL